MGKEFLNLGLYIVLLSFFIVLNGQSVFEESRAKAIINSLYSAFSTKYVLRPNYSPSSPLDMPADTDRAGASLEQIEAIFLDIFPDMQVGGVMSGDALRLRLPREDFEMALHDGGSYGRAFSLMVASLAGGYERPAVVMDVVFEYGSGGMDRAMIRSLGEVAEVLDGFGLSTDLYSVAAADGEDGIVVLSFSRKRDITLDIVAGARVPADGGGLAGE